jgi:phosphatidylglycerol---prolipoprotein diacylglyceryl transferase
MQFPNIDPIFLQIGPLAFRWYGLMYILGFVSAYFIISAGAKRRNLPLTRDDVADLIFSVAMGIILGGRFGYVLFYNFSFYLEHPLKAIAIWEGGMSFHGGVSGAILAGWWYARKKKIHFFRMADIGFMAGPVGLFFGRIGNFINGELYGRTTTVSWGLVFPGGGPYPRHPSQLYEAFLEGPVLLLILWVTSRKNRPDGVVFWTFIAGYGLFRSFVELFREPDAQIGLFLGSVSMGQLLSLPMFILGVMMVYVTAKGQKVEG